MVTDEGREITGDVERIEEEKIEKNVPPLVVCGDDETDEKGKDKIILRSLEGERRGVQMFKGDAHDSGKVEQEQDIGGVTSTKDNNKQLEEDVQDERLEIMEETEGKKDAERIEIEGDIKLTVKEEKKKRKENLKKEKKRKREKSKGNKINEEVLKEEGETREEMEGIFERKKKNKGGEGKPQEKIKKHKRVEKLHDEYVEVGLVEDLGERKRKKKSEKKKGKDKKLNNLETTVPIEVLHDSGISFVNVKSFESMDLSDDD
jgi:hypothetical protein